MVSCSVFCMHYDDEYYGRAPHGYPHHWSMPVTPKEVVVISSAVSSVLHDEDRFLLQQLQRDESASKTGASVSAPLRRSQSDLHQARIYGCEVPTPLRPNSPVQQMAPKQSQARTVDHPLVSSGGIMPE